MSEVYFEKFAKWEKIDNTTKGTFVEVDLEDIDVNDINSIDPNISKQIENTVTIVLVGIIIGFFFLLYVLYIKRKH